MVARKGNPGEFRQVVDATPALAFSVVVPAFNEAANLSALHARLLPVMDGLGGDWELVLVNDGSRDATLDVMLRLQAQDGRVAVVNLSRNFGKEVATTAGLDHSRGAAVILIKPGQAGAGRTREVPRRGQSRRGPPPPPPPCLRVPGCRPPDRP